MQAMAWSPEPIRLHRPPQDGLWAIGAQASAVSTVTGSQRAIVKSRPLLPISAAVSSLGSVACSRMRRRTRRNATALKDLLLGDQETSAVDGSHREDLEATSTKTSSGSLPGQSGLQSMSKADLVELCRTHGLGDTSRSKKYELIEYLLEQSPDPQPVQHSVDSADLSSLAFDTFDTFGRKAAEASLREVFTKAKADGKALQLPATVGRNVRAVAHIVATELGLNHESHGDGTDRCLWIWRS